MALQPFFLRIVQNTIELSCFNDYNGVELVISSQKYSNTKAETCMKYMRDELKSEFNRYARQYPDLDELQNPMMNISDILRAYFILADYFSDPTADADIEKMLVGIRDMNLLVSALGRQNASFAGHVKYSRPLDVCATLFFGLVKNHAFADGNKRTALLTLLYQLDQYGYSPQASNKEFEKLVVAVASNDLEKKYPKIWKQNKQKKDTTDICVGVIAALLKKWTKRKDNSFHIDMTAREFMQAMNKITDCVCTIDGGKMKIQRTIKRTTWFFQHETTTKNYSIPYRGDTRTIGAGTAREVLEQLDLYDQYPDYASFFQGDDPRYMLIQQFEGPLRRLKDK